MYSTRSAKFLAALTCRFFLIIWLELSLLRPYIQLLAHESPNFVCNTLFNTLTRIDVNKNGVCDIGQFFFHRCWSDKLGDSCFVQISILIINKGSFIS